MIMTFKLAVVIVIWDVRLFNILVFFTTSYYKFLFEMDSFSISGRKVYDGLTFVVGNVAIESCIYV